MHAGGLRFGIDGRVLTVEMLPDIPDASYEAVSGAQISATCATNVAGDSRGGITLTRPWPADRTILSFRFAREVSGWCRLEDQSGSTVAFVRFPGVPPGAKEQIAETAEINPEGIVALTGEDGDAVADLGDGI